MNQKGISTIVIMLIVVGFLAMVDGVYYLALQKSSQPEQPQPILPTQPEEQQPSPIEVTFQSLLSQNTELENFFENVTEKYPSLSPDKFQKKETKQIETIEGSSTYYENSPVWTLSPDKTKAVSSLGYYGQPDSSLEIYNRRGDKKVELLKTCGTPCSYQGEFWLNNNQFVFIQRHEYYPSNREVRCAANTKCTDIISVSLYDLEKNTETIYESPELERTDLNRPILLPSLPSRDLQLKSACEGLFGKDDPYCQTLD